MIQSPEATAVRAAWAISSAVGATPLMVRRNGLFKIVTARGVVQVAMTRCRIWLVRNDDGMLICGETSVGDAGRLLRRAYSGHRPHQQRAPDDSEPVSLGASVRCRTTTSMLVVAEPGSFQVEASLHALAGGLGNRAAFVKPGEFSVFSADEVAAQFPFGQAAWAWWLAVVDAGAAVPDAAFQAGAARSITASGAASSPASSSSRASAASASRSRATVSSWRAAAGRAILARRARGSRVSPCTISDTTMTAVASTRMRSRSGSGAAVAEVRGMDRARG